MEYRHLGRSGLKVSELAYGNWITHGSQVEEDAARACVAAALDEGVTTFDTADVYAGTRAEEVLGRALHGVRRESVEICTKVYWPTGPGPNDRGLSRKHIMESAHASLRRLQTDYLDLYQAHRYDYETPLAETLRAFEDLVRQGKVLYVGVSEWRAEEIAAALRIADEMGFDRIVSNQPQYNMLWRVIEADVLPLCEQEGIGQIVFSPIAQGILTGKYRPGEPLPAGSRATDPSGSGFISRFLSDDLLRAVAGLAPLAAEAGLSLAQLAVAWVLQNPGVSAAIIGATRPEQVRENVKAAGVQLPADLMKRIDEVLGASIQRDPSPDPGAQRPGPNPSGLFAGEAGVRRRRVPASPANPRRVPGGGRDEAKSPGPRGSPPGYSACRLIGPYSTRASSMSVTWSTPSASRSRQFSPSQLSASPWLLNVSRPAPRDGIVVPSAVSNCQLQAMVRRLLPRGKRQ